MPDVATTRAGRGCCGQERDTRYCPDCGKAVTGTNPRGTLIDHLLRCTKRRKGAVGIQQRNIRCAAYANGESWTDNVKREQTERLAIMESAVVESQAWCLLVGVISDND